MKYTIDTDVIFLSISKFFTRIFIAFVSGIFGYSFWNYTKPFLNFTKPFLGDFL